MGIPAGAMVTKGPGLLVWATATDHGYVVDTSGKVSPQSPESELGCTGDKSD